MAESKKHHTTVVSLLRYPPQSPLTLFTDIAIVTETTKRKPAAEGI